MRFTDRAPCLRCFFLSASILSKSVRTLDKFRRAFFATSGCSSRAVLPRFLMSGMKQAASSGPSFIFDFNDLVHACFLLLVFFLPQTVSADPFAGAVTGVVLDVSTGEPVEDVSLIIAGTILGTSSDNRGRFTIPGVPPGLYTIEASHVVYRSAVIDGVLVKMGDVRYLSVALEPEVRLLVGVTATAQRSAPVAGASIIIEPGMGAAAGDDAADLLLENAAIAVTRPDGRGGPAWASLRGSSPEHVLVIVDGIRFNDPATGLADLSRIPAVSIEKIVVVFGPATASLGNAAMSGAILITTGSGRSDTGAEASAGGGSHGFRSASASFSSGDFYLDLASLGAGRTPDPQGRFRNRAFSSFRASAAFSKSGFFDWKTDASYYTRRRGVPGTDELIYDHAYSTEHLLTAGASARRLVAGACNLRFTGGGSLSEKHYINEEIIPVRERSRIGAAELKGELEWSAGEMLLLSGGTSASLEKFRGDNLLSPERSAGTHERFSAGLFTGGFFDPASRLRLGLSGRFDRIDGSGLASARVDLEADLSGRGGFEAVVVAGWGAGYRLPTFNELYWVRDQYAEGNSDLEPETSRALDASVEVSSGPLREWSVRLSGHYTEFGNLIYWMPTPPERRWKPFNLAAARLSGCELLLARSPLESGLTASLAVSLQNSEDLEGSPETEPNTYGNELVYRPSFTTAGGIGWREGLFSVSVDGRYVGERHATRANTVKLAAYGLIDLNASCTGEAAGYEVEGGININNVMNSRPLVYQDTTGPGREWNLSISIKGDNRK